MYWKELIEHENIMPGQDHSMLDAISLDSIINRNFTVLQKDTLIKDFYRLLTETNANIFAVVNNTGGLLGVVLMDQVRKQLFNERPATATIQEIMTPAPAIIDYYQPMNDVMETFDALDVWQLPVVKDDIFVGFISKSALLAQYREVIIKQHKEADLFARG